jgi:hypothetical protein
VSFFDLRASCDFVVDGAPVLVVGIVGTMEVEDDQQGVHILEMKISY